MADHIRLTTAAREDLADAKLLLSSAAANAHAALIGDEALQAMDNALAMAEQALVTLRRVRDGVRR